MKAVNSWFFKMAAFAAFAFAAAYVATGYEVIDNTEYATCVAYPYAIGKVSQYAAQIVTGTTTNTYTTLEAAIEAVEEGETIEILRNNSESFEVNKNCSFSINAKGRILTGTVTVSSEVKGYQFILTDTGCKFTKNYVIDFAFFTDEPAKTDQTSLPADMVVYREKSWDLPVFTAGNFNSANYTFVGWTDKNDSGVIIKEFGAGNATNATLYAKFKPLAKPNDGGTIEVKPTEEAETKTAIKVTQEWVDANVAPTYPNKTAKEINTVLETPDANGLKKWQNYVLGLDGSVTATVTSGAAQTDDVNTIPVVPDVNPKADTGFTVKYELDYVSGDEPVNVISATNIEALVIDLNAIEKSAKFKVNVVLTPVGSESGETITATNTIGVLKTAAASTQSLLSVPWNDFGSDEGVTIAGLVKTANLTPEDKIYVASTNPAVTYFSWTLGTDRTWSSDTYDILSKTGIKTGQVTSPSADSFTVSRGTAVWIERTDTSTPVCFYGQSVEVENAKSALAKASSATAPSWNLVSSPSDADLDLSNTATKGKIKAVQGDEIQIPTATTPVKYRFDGTDWCRQTTTTVTIGGRDYKRTVWSPLTSDNAIPAGQGFWYLNSDTKGRTIEWKDVTTVE